MTYNFEPLDRVVEHIKTLGFTWQEVAEDLDQGHITPVPYHHERRRIVGRSVEAIVAGESPTVVLYVRPRSLPDTENHVPVVGVEPRRRMPRSRGGAGNQWPTTFTELMKLAERDRTVRVVKGARHWIVLRDGQQVCVLPLTASDHRSLMNATKQLHALGINVRRSQ
jgi:hypothetical protein